MNITIIVQDEHLSHIQKAETGSWEVAQMHLTQMQTNYENAVERETQEEDTF